MSTREALNIALELILRDLETTGHQVAYSKAARRIHAILQQRGAPDSRWDDDNLCDAIDIAIDG